MLETRARSEAADAIFKIIRIHDSSPVADSGSPHSRGADGRCVSRDDGGIIVDCSLKGLLIVMQRNDGIGIQADLSVIPHPPQRRKSMKIGRASCKERV